MKHFEVITEVVVVDMYADIHIPTDVPSPARLALLGLFVQQTLGLSCAKVEKALENYDLQNRFDFEIGGAQFRLQREKACYDYSLYGIETQYSIQERIEDEPF